MDFLNKGWAQLGDLFRSLTPAARITSGLLLAVIVVSLGYLFQSQTSGPDGYLLGGQAFSASELPAMEAAFGKANLANYSVDGNRVRIPRGQQAAYMAALADSGALPANFGDHLSAAVKDSSPFMSRTQQEEALKSAKQRELALIVRSMQGIENAAVHYDLQKKSGFGQASRLVTASVSVKPRGVQPLDEKKVPVIRHLVAGAIAGLSPENVTVVDLNGRSYAGGSASGMGSALEDPYSSRLKEYENEFRAKVLEALSYVPGIVVAVNVELDREVNRTRDETKVDPKAVAVSVNETSLTKSSEGSAGGGQPGYQAQQPNRPAALAHAAKGPTTQEDQSSTQTHNVVSHDHTKTVEIGLTPKLVKYAIAVPSDYFTSVWRQKNPTPPGQPAPAPDPAALEKIEVEETANIRKHVAMLVSNVDATVDATTRVTVTTFSRLPVEPLSEPGLAATALTWFGNSWSTVGMIGLAGASLVMLRSLVKSPATATAPSPAMGDLAAALAETSRDEQPAKTEPVGEDGKPKSRLKRRLGSGTSLREELVDMVREDPDAAANILRGWIGKPN